MIACYLDESGTDGNSPTAVVGGLLLQKDAFFGLDVEWEKALARHGFTPPIHMKEFVPDGRFGEGDHASRRALLRHLVSIINEHKTLSIGATVSTQELTSAYSGVVDRKIFGPYGTCFLLLGHLTALSAQVGKYRHEIPFVMDAGNQYARHVRDAHVILRQVHSSAGSLSFETDTKVRALQAADVIAWSVRRRIAGKFNNGFEPLPDLFEVRHNQQNFEREWLNELAEELKASTSPIQPPTQPHLLS